MRLFGRKPKPQDYRWQDDQPLHGCEFAARLQPGTTIDGGAFYRRPDDPQTIDVAHIEDLSDGMVRIHDVSGWSTVTAADMCCHIETPELADLKRFLLLAEQERHCR